MYRLLFAALLGIATTTTQATDWTTPAEAAQFHTTPSYADTLAYLERLQRAAPGVIQLETFGTTPQGRPMTVVIASAGGSFTPTAARAVHKPVVLLQAGIHPGEIEGKDAGLMLLRDVAVAGKYPHLLDRVVLVYIPVFSVDGHENASPYHRINQNGPESMGFRGQSQYLNLNRDYVKADAPEMRAWLKLWQRWLPDFLIDVHTTDGADYQYDLTWYTEDPHKLNPAVSAWQHDAIVNHVLPAYEKRGHLASIYLEFKDGRDPRKGIVNFGSGPRFSTGYAALQNRPALLIETHMLKPYANRVRAVYDLVELMLERIGAQPAALLAATAKADADTVARARDTNARVALSFKPDPQPAKFELKGYAFTLSHSDISNSEWIRYDPRAPKNYTIDNWNGLLPDVLVAPPAAYAVPAQWTALIDRLDAHGITYRRTDRPLTIRAEGYLLDDPVWASKPFEGHLMLRDFRLRAVPRQVSLPAGSAIVPLDQRAANVAIELLEPRAPDSLLRWGFLDAVFEPKEYGEPRVLEQLARDMLAKDPALQTAFARKLHDDPAFAADSRTRLMYFFERSPWYAAQDVGAYPVLRLDAAQLPQLPAPQHSPGGRHNPDL
ncbi:peptidase M14 [Rhodanobacter thiooxydans]|uniref:Peptidase M14 n=1 Tax=Rhodanobacter thiooxydans TaxID=416169 RepID=A0A154QM67_9GAMM|nr:M14 family metallopeptidase [Rhodanobacter thiooxydans]EIM00528.1 putative carboxypeptidase [Rhodanobacter thiooxydans LCS2]KZC25299.1 peptidase M14 [Rhodanobacter thiooxydans]MCW0200900.1 M14 family metallopeptidase [Rhodanobacter thiooxydans]